MSSDTPPLWETNPDLFLRNEDGSFVLTAKGVPRKKAGKPVGTKNAYNHHSQTKEKMRLKSLVRYRKKKVEKLQHKLEDERKKLKKRTEQVDTALSVMEGKEAPTVLSQTDIEALPESVKKELKLDQKELIFSPNPGPQTEFLSAPEKEVLYGGAAGGGKSYALLADPLRYIKYKEHKALILRKTLPELTELIDKSRGLYPKAYPGAVYKEAKKTWEFPSGAKIQFGYCERDADVYQYQGQSYTWIGFDELTHLPTSFAWDYLGSRLRTINPEIKTYMRATANPGGVGHDWVKKRFIDPAPPNTTVWTSYRDSRGQVVKYSKKYIPARLSDNPYLYDSGEYELMLLTLDPVSRKRLLEGDWNIVEGSAFPEFDPSIHVIQPMEIPVGWDRFKAIDYGYRAPSCCLWFAVDPSDGTLIVYRELYQKELSGTALGNKMNDLEADEMRSIGGILDGAAWNKSGSTGPTVGEEIAKTGHKLRRADKNREAGKIQVHERLRPNPSTGRPKVQIFSTCTNIIKQLQYIPVDNNNKEDVDTKAEDHAYDAFRYGVMSRPRIEDPYLRMMNFRHRAPVVADENFGY